MAIIMHEQISPNTVGESQVERRVFRFNPDGTREYYALDDNNIKQPLPNGLLKVVAPQAKEQLPTALLED